MSQLPQLNPTRERNALPMTKQRTPSLPAACQAARTFLARFLQAVPTAPKPASIIAQFVGSGTPPVTEAVMVSLIGLSARSSNPG